MITFINLPSPFLYVDRDQIPLGLLYLGSVLKNNGYDVEVLDLADVKNWESRVSQLDSDFIGISATTPQFNIAKKVVELVSCNSKPFMMAGGPQPTIVPDIYLKNGFDSVCVGEGERAVLKMVRGIEGKVSEPWVDNLDEIPLPAWDMIDIKSYKQTFLGKKLVHLMTSRGCPYRCAFCSHSVFQSKVRFRSADNILEEVNKLHENYGYERFMFMDDTFLVNPNLNEVLEKLKKLGVLWRCHFRANLVTKERLQAMYESGCRHITLGIESGSQKILNNINKGTTIEQNTAAVRLAREVGLAVKAFTIVGLPGETMETMEATKKWLLDNRPNDFDLQIFHPYEDCDIYQHPEKYDIKFDKNINYDESWFKGNPKSPVSTSGLTAEQITEWRNTAFDELVKEIRPKRPV